MCLCSIHILNTIIISRSLFLSFSFYIFEIREESNVINVTISKQLDSQSNWKTKINIDIRRKGTSRVNDIPRGSRDAARLVIYVRRKIAAILLSASNGGSGGPRD